MPEEIRTGTIAEEFEKEGPFVDLDWDDLGFGSAPEGWEGRMGRDFMFLKHQPCAGVWRFFAGFTGPKAMKKILLEHQGTCRK